MKKAGFIFLLVALFFSLSGCMSMSTMHTARPIKKGNAELQSALVGVGVVANEKEITDIDGNTTKQDITFAWPSGETQIRYGFGERFDAGAKLFFPGLGVDFNILIVNQEKFALSIDPAATIMWIPLGVANVVVSTIWLPVLMDVLDVKYLTITVGLKPGIFIGHASESVSANDETAFTATGFDGYAGGMVGFKIKFTDEIYAIPEFNCAWQFKEKMFWWQGVIAVGYTI